MRTSREFRGGLVALPKSSVLWSILQSTLDIYIWTKQFKTKVLGYCQDLTKCTKVHPEVSSFIKIKLRISIESIKPSKQTHKDVIAQIEVLYKQPTGKPQRTTKYRGKHSKNNKRNKVKDTEAASGTFFSLKSSRNETRLILH